MTASQTDHLHRAPLTVRILNKFFHKWGLLMADNDKAVVIVFTIITLLCSSKIAFTKQEDDIRKGWSPIGARSIVEMEAYGKYIGPNSTDPIASMVFVEAIDGGTMMRVEYMKEAMKLLDDLTSLVSWKNETFNTMCGSFCSINEPLRQFYNAMVMEATRNGSDETSVLRMTLNFPFMEVLGKELDLSPHFYGVQQKERGKGIDFLKVVMLNLQAFKPDSWTRSDVMEYERELYKFAHDQFENDLIKAHCLSLTFATDEVVRTGMIIFPFIGIGFVIMSVFAVITVWYSSSQYNQWSIHRVSLAVLGCVCPLMATGTALGLLFILGFRFGTILAVTPFLVLAIGVDDAFLQLQSWSRYYAENPSATVSERVAEMLVDIGPSITITSLTNCISFLIGYFTPTPEIQLFCVGNAIAIAFDFVYQITIYTAMMSVAGRLEMRDPKKQKAVFKWSEKKNEFMDRLLDDYSQWLSSKFTAIFVFIALVAYWFISFQGAQQMEVMLSSKSLVIQDSKLIYIENLREQYVLPNYTTVMIFVNDARNLGNSSRLQLATNLIEQFEALPGCIGPQMSHFWLRDYQTFQEISGEDEEESESTEVSKIVADPFTNETMSGFLNWPEFRHWGGFLRFDEQGKLSHFMATVSYHGDNLGEFNMRRDQLKRWRDIVDKFPELDASIFDDFATFVDQVDTILPATVSSSICTLFCMIIVCFLFMYNVFTVTVASFAITSICLGVFGLLAFWGINLDPISMSCVIMSIGFSVDFPAHVTYHYFREGIEEPDAPPSRRIARSLVAIGFPLLQCGVSTILFVLCLLFIKTYMGEVFVKTIVLVVSLGLVHGLVVVPTFLCALTNIHTAFCNRNKVEDETPTGSTSLAGILRVSRSASEGKLSNESVIVVKNA